MSDNQRSSKHVLDDIPTLLYAFVSTVNKIEQYSKDVNTPKDNEALRTKLRKSREKAKADSKVLMSKFESVKKDNSYRDNEKLFQKLYKQFKEVFERFQKESRKSVEEEKKAAKKYVEQLNIGGHQLQNEYDTSYVQLELMDEVDRGVKVALGEYDANTIELEKNMSREKLQDLKKLEVDMDDLNTCYVELKGLLLEQNEGLDHVEDNVDQANSYVIEGIDDIKAANKHASKGRLGLIILIILIILVAIGIAIALYFGFSSIKTT
jgi:t-SNARE complex subunit (syntaxin)